MSKQDNIVMYSITNIFLLIQLLNLGSFEVFTSVEDMKSVLEIEKNLTRVVENYIEMEKRKIELLEKYVKDQKRQHEIAFKDVESYVFNPINAFHLIKRLTADWENLQRLITANNSYESLEIVFQYKNHSRFPSNEDLSGVATGLLRLQSTYGFDEEALINGVIGGRKYDSTLSGSDCYELGRAAYTNDDFYLAIRWLKQADEKLKDDPIRKYVLELLAQSVYHCDNKELAMNYSKELLKISPDHHNSNLTETLNNEIMQASCEASATQVDLLCRKAIETPKEVAQELNCLYVDNNNPFLLIAPFKMEELCLKPRIVVFHEIISDREIDIVKELSLPKMERAGIYIDYMPSISKDRIVKVAWLSDNINESISKISRRISDMTGLHVKSAESLQAANYGIGGFYSEHCDFNGRNNSYAEFGDRIATALIYLSNVEMGGATIFTSINVTVQPIKGTAALWYNLDPYGDGIGDTVHTACPVIYGSKWVANKWIHEAGQELSRPCPLHKNLSEYKASIHCTQF